ncbi:MAG TPA: cytochrome c-type biogenesis protein CcmH, partial [Vicinamibacterales bacterium]|nr:cytochrome c-type biogenesis protein CcmH [Vicinamibacterales bacterium]
MGSLAHVSVALWVAAAAAAVPVDEREAKRIEALLIAPCCWSQQVSVHQGPVVDEIRQDIRRLLGEGKTRQQILDVYVARYGDRILAEPPARGFSRL